MTTRIKLRRDTAANWTSNDPVLALGEAGYDTTNNQLRVGDGTSVWSDLDVLGGLDSMYGITLTGTIPYVEPVLVDAPVTFTRPNASTNTVDAIDTGLTLKRANQGALYNSAGNVETSYNQNTSPLGTEWNADGWGDLANVKTRTYTNFTDTVQNNTWLAAGIHHKELVMHDTINDKYYTFKFSWWQANGGYGSGDGVDQKSGFSYVRQLINTDPTVNFAHPGGDANSNQDDVGSQLSITRSTSGGGIYNASEEGGWDADVSPYGTLWNDEGWDDFEDISSRTWKPFFAAVHGRLGNEIVGRELLMKDTHNNKYYVLMFTEWGSDDGGSFAYWRREVSPTGTKIGITFADGTRQTSAFNPGEMTIANNTIRSTKQDINIQTVTDPLDNADININSSNNIWMYAGGEFGVQIESANTVAIGTGDSEFISYSPGNIYWTGTNIVINNTQWWMETAVQQYLTNTYNLWFRDSSGTWHRTESTGLATYYSTGTIYTIPVVANNTGTQLSVNNIELHDPNYSGNTWWYFNRNGHLSPPNDTIGTWHPWDTEQQATLKLGDEFNSSDVAISNADRNTNYRDGGSIKIMGQRGYGHWSDTTGYAGNGTDIKIWAGAGGESSTPNQGGEGGNIEVHAGVGQGGRNGGDISITAGDAAYTVENTSTNVVTGGAINIRAGDALDDIVAGKGVGGDINIIAGRGNLSNGAVTIQTSINSSSYITWAFNTDGGTIFPQLTTQRGDDPNGSTISGQTLLFGNPSQEAVISTLNGFTGSEYSQRLVINPGQGYNYGEGGDIYLWAGRGGDGSGSGGDIKIRGGQGGTYTDGGQGGDGGYIRIEGGDAVGRGDAGYIEITGGAASTQTGGAIILTGGDSTQNLGGNVLIRAGDSTLGSTASGAVVVGSGGNSWVFSNTGTVTFPDATIQRSAYPTGQQTVYVNTASTLESINLTEITGSVIMITPEVGYITTGETHDVYLPFGTDAIPLGTRVTVINLYDGTANVGGWPAPGFTMSQYQSIEMVYYYDPVLSANVWWVTNQFIW